MKSITVTTEMSKELREALFRLADTSCEKGPKPHKRKNLLDELLDKECPHCGKEI